MKSIIVLNKDQSVKVISESEYKYSKDIKYLLFPIDDPHLYVQSLNLSFLHLS